MKFVGLELKDFQRHKSLLIKFSPLITTILGETDIGKSAILRALRWACQNVPSGEEFIRSGSKSTSVRLEAVNSSDKRLVIVRSKEPGENLYQLGKKEYRAFGMGVPQDISQVLQVPDINFQGQHDAPFWFSESAAEVSRQLNAVIDLSIIDESLSRIAATVRQSRERKEICEERLGAIQRRGMSLLLVEQNASSLELAARGLVLENGSPVLAGDRYALQESDFVRRAYLGV